MSEILKWSKHNGIDLEQENLDPENKFIMHEFAYGGADSMMRAITILHKHYPNISQHIQWIGHDTDPLANKYLEKIIAEDEQKGEQKIGLKDCITIDKKNGNVFSYVGKTLKKAIEEGDEELYERSMNMLYSIGINDYTSDKTVAEQVCFAMNKIKKGGRFAFGNLGPGKSATLLTVSMNWELNLRNKVQLENIAREQMLHATILTDGVESPLFSESEINRFYNNIRDLALMTPEEKENQNDYEKLQRQLDRYDKRISEYVNIRVTEITGDTQLTLEGEILNDNFKIDPKSYQDRFKKLYTTKDKAGNLRGTVNGEPEIYQSYFSADAQTCIWTDPNSPNYDAQFTNKFATIIYYSKQIKKDPNIFSKLFMKDTENYFLKNLTKIDQTQEPKDIEKDFLQAFSDAKNRIIKDLHDRLKDQELDQSALNQANQPMQVKKGELAPN